MRNLFLPAALLMLIGCTESEVTDVTQETSTVVSRNRTIEEAAAIACDFLSQGNVTEFLIGFINCKFL